MTEEPSADAALSPDDLPAASRTHGTWSPIRPMVQPFPQPGLFLRAAMGQLQQAAIDPPISEQQLQALSQLPRPWDPGTCTGQVRAELWEWLEAVASWVNEEHLWNVARPGIPECWPAHPHLAHDLALLACSRYFTTFAIQPAALEDWHRYGLPGFLERLHDRLGDSCQPGRHQPRARHERDASYASQAVRLQRRRCYRDDIDHAD